MHGLFAGLSLHPKSWILATLGLAGGSVRVWELSGHHMIAPKEETRVIDVGSQAASAAVTLEQKRDRGEYDVFICDNSLDRDAVFGIVRRLTDRGILPWFDERDVRPGRYWLDELKKHLERIKAMAVFVGKNNVGLGRNKRWTYASPSSRSGTVL